MSALHRILRPLALSALLLLGLCPLGASTPMASSQPPPATSESEGAIPDTPTPLADDALPLLSRVEGLLRLGRHQAAATLASGLPLEGPHAQAARRLRCWTLLMAGSYGELAALLEEEAESPELRFLEAAARWRAGEASGGAELRLLWWDAPDGVWGAAAARELAAPAKQPSPYSSSERALLLKIIPAPSADAALGADASIGSLLSTLQRGVPRHGVLAAEVQHATGVRLLRAEKFTEAVTALRRAVAQTKEAELRRVIELRLGEAERRRGSYQAAQRYFDAVAAGRDDRFSQQALALAGQMAIEYRRYPEARRLFEEQLLRNPIGPARQDALWGLGWVAFRTGDFIAARRFFTALHAEAPYGALAPRSMYWAARSLEELGERELARQELTSLAAEFPLDYYAFRAGDHAHARDPLASPRTAGIANPDVAHVRSLVDAGMNRRAQAALRVLLPSRGALGPDDLTALVEAATAVGEEQLADRFREALHSRFPAGPEAIETIAARFPSGIVARLSAAAKRERVDPNLPAAVVRQESAFNARAVSPVGALGLMQIMPQTARGLLHEERRRPAGAAPDLLDVDTNIRLGVRYLGRVLRAFDHRLEYALASYNAGPGAVTRWREARGDLPPDIFVEEIPYAETRDYVRRVLAALQALRFLQTAQMKSAAAPTVAALP